MKASTSRAKPGTKKQLESDAAVSYDEFKEFEGQRYTGMQIGRSHKWYYDQGEWKEKKITPDLWQISYAVTKRRAGRAPEGSGVPVGTEYHRSEETRLNSSHLVISYAVFCLKKKRSDITPSCYMKQ